MKRFRFRFTVSQTFEVTLTEDQMYPDYPWHLYPEHANARKEHPMATLTVERVKEYVRANGGADAIIEDWRLDPAVDPEAKVIGRRVRLNIEQLPSLPRRKGSK